MQITFSRMFLNSEILLSSRPSFPIVSRNSYIYPQVKNCKCYFPGIPSSDLLISLSLNSRNEKLLILSNLCPPSPYALFPVSWVSLFFRTFIHVHPNHTKSFLFFFSFLYQSLLLIDLFS